MLLYLLVHSFCSKVVNCPTAVLFPIPFPGNPILEGLTMILQALPLLHLHKFHHSNWCLIMLAAKYFGNYACQNLLCSIDFCRPKWPHALKNTSFVRQWLPPYSADESTSLPRAQCPVCIARSLCRLQSLRSPVVTHFSAVCICTVKVLAEGACVIPITNF